MYIGPAVEIYKSKYLGLTYPQANSSPPQAMVSNYPRRRMYGTRMIVSRTEAPVPNEISSPFRTNAGFEELSTSMESQYLENIRSLSGWECLQYLDIKFYRSLPGTSLEPRLFPVLIKVAYFFF